jgi:malonyl-CoA O-methyltransferase
VIDVRTGYALWASQYPPYAHNPLMVVEQNALLELMPDPAGLACLDLACGTGRYMKILIDRGARSVAGVDYSLDMLVHGRRQTPGLPVAQAPFLDLPFRSGSFDLVTCALAVAYERSLSGLLDETARVLRPGGTIVYSDRHPFRTLSGPPRHQTQDGAELPIEQHLHYFADHVRACREAGLRMQSAREPLSESPGGPQMKGIPLILAISAVKDPVA